MPKPLNILVLVLIASGCRCRPASPSHPSTPPPPIRQSSGITVHVPRINSPIKIDGELTELPWRTQEWVSSLFQDAQGKEAPFTQLKAMGDDKNLYLEVYVADQDLRSQGDEVAIEIGPLHLDLHPKHSIVPPGVQIADDTDGTIDKPEDYDEEWVTEMAIPWDLLKSHEVQLRATRIDTGRFAPTKALAWPPKGSATFVFN